MRLGKSKHEYDKRDLQFAHYRGPGELPKRPNRFGHENIPEAWGMLGNDEVGDCVFAGFAHQVMVANYEAHRLVKFSKDSVLSDYSTVTGYRPDRPHTDRGTNVRTGLKYWQKTGVADETGKRHQIAAYLALEPGNLEHLYEALYLFGSVGIGLELPSSAMDQFDAGRTWTRVSGSPSEGGHYVPLVAKRGHLECVTWGRVQPMTVGFYQAYCDEAWAILDAEMLGATGVSPEGFDLAALKADLTVLGQ